MCDMSFQEGRLEQSDQTVHETQRTVLEQLRDFLQAAQVKSFSVRLCFCHNLITRVETTKNTMSESHICILGGGDHRTRVEDHGEDCPRATDFFLQVKSSRPAGDDVLLSLINSKALVLMERLRTSCSLLKSETIFPLLHVEGHPGQPGVHAEDTGGGGESQRRTSPPSGSRGELADLPQSCSAPAEAPGAGRA